MGLNARAAGLRGGLALVAMLGTVGLAGAQSTGSGSGQTGAGMNANVIGAGSGSAQGAKGNDVVNGAQGGVGGTGLGKVPPSGSAPGTGMSVKGPPGQGISNSTDTSQ